MRARGVRLEPIPPELERFHAPLPPPAAPTPCLPFLTDEEGTEALRRYFRTYSDLAASLGLGLVLESPTWRAALD